MVNPRPSPRDFKPPASPGLFQEEGRPSRAQEFMDGLRGNAARRGMSPTRPDRNRHEIVRTEIAFAESGPPARDLVLGASADKVEPTSVGLRVLQPLEFDEWEHLLKTFIFMDGAIQWWVGDLINYGEQRWGDKYAQAIDLTDYRYKTLRNQASVAFNVGLSLRRDNLSWSHHAAVAYVDTPSAMGALLDWAEQPLKEGEDRPHSVAELSAERDRRAGKVAPARQAEPIALIRGDAETAIGTLTTVLRGIAFDEPDRRFRIEVWDEE